MSQLAGQYITSIQGNQVFIPEPLPPKLRFTPDLLRLIEETTHRMGQVEMCRMLLPNASLLIYGSLRREAIASSTIEGTIASPDELVRFQVAQHTERQAVREVANYQSALEWGYDQIQDQPLASRLVLGLHERLLLDARGGGAAGAYKTRQNWIGVDRLQPIDKAQFVPPSPEETPQLMAQLERYLNLQNSEPKIVQCALGHYQFETIHPFHDGNGRVGRLLIILHMIKLGLLSAPLIYPSGYFERNRSEYIAHLQAVREHSAWIPWIEFFTRGIAEQCQDTILLTQNIIALQRHLEGQVGNVRRRASILAVIKVFFHEPVLSVPELATRTQMSVHTVQSALDDLMSRNIVMELSGKQRGRIYACRPILDVIFGPYMATRQPDKEAVQQPVPTTVVSAETE